MPFLLLEFNDGFSVVPDNWYDDKKNTAFYPPGNLAHMSRNRLVKDKCAPQKHWKKYKVKKLHQILETFEEANDVLDYFLDCSASDVSEVERRYKIRTSENCRSSKLRKIDMQGNSRNQIIDSSGEELSDRESTSLPPYPNTPNMFDMDLSGRDELLGELPTSTPKKVYKKSPALQLTDEEFKTNTSAKIGKILYQQKILDEQQQIILLNQEKILGLLLQKESSLPQLESDEMRKMFPLKTVQDLDNLSSLITEEEKMKQLVRICKSVGGIDVKQSVMRRLLADNLCAAFSFQGRRKKPAFDHFLINEAIKSSIKERFPEATDPVVDKYVKDHLRYAPQREKRINGNEDDTLKEVIN
ncbi:hypothetical protein JTE90_012434 [Oedothorax gibbosus]|uniref:DUF4806 domain-containing protein n=1 Tax=Oedothorax gibbosus TaxID=931172 RepID=A0AAV6TPE4_9ARAC|nr:hypothetical protein JTE90_012434 [Oedothorax gibbosus]